MNNIVNCTNLFFKLLNNNGINIINDYSNGKTVV